MKSSVKAVQIILLRVICEIVLSKEKKYLRLLKHNIANVYNNCNYQLFKVFSL